VGAWFEMYSTWETLGVQLLAALLVVGSYFLAEERKVKRPRRRGLQPAARRAEAPPPTASGRQAPEAALS
jgi:high-affinity iron transporter